MKPWNLKPIVHVFIVLAIYNSTMNRSALIWKWGATKFRIPLKGRGIEALELSACRYWSLELLYETLKCDKKLRLDNASKFFQTNYW